MLVQLCGEVFSTSELSIYSEMLFCTGQLYEFQVHRFPLSQWEFSKESWSFYLLSFIITEKKKNWWCCHATRRWKRWFYRLWGGFFSSYLRNSCYLKIFVASVIDVTIIDVEIQTYWHCCQQWNIKPNP